MLGTASKLLQLFDRRERWQLLGLVLAVLVMALIETFSVASILPFMTLVADPDAITQVAWLSRIHAWAGSPPVPDFLLLLGLAVLGVVVLANLVSAATLWWTLRFMWAKVHRLSRAMLASYLRRPYAFFLDRNTADLAKNILTEVLIVSTGMLLPALNVAVRGTVAVALFLLLFALDPVLSIVVAGVLGGAYSLLYLGVRRRQTRSGRERLQAHSERFQMALEALTGIKDVKAMGRERAFLERFDRPSREFSRYTARAEMIEQIPRYAMETVAFGGILLIVLYLLASGEGLGRTLPLLSVYAFAGYKLLPALQQVFRGLAQIRFYDASLDALHRDLEAGGRGRDEGPRAGENTTAPLPFEHMLEVRDVAFRYPGAEEPALRGVDLTVRRGQLVGVVGTTGSGKTTLVDILLGLLVPSTGELRVDGRLVTSANVEGWRERIGYVQQEIFLLDDTIARNIAFGMSEADLDPARVRRAAETAQLDAFVRTLPAGYETVVGERGVRLSGGQRQRIGIARALYREPEVLILDEGTSDLDTVTEGALAEALREADPERTIVWVTHRLATVRACDRIFLIEEGRVVDEGPYEALLESSSRFREMAAHR